MYSYDKVLTFVREEDVKFIRLVFFDAFGVQKNISIMSEELERAFRDGISFDASAIEGFGDEVKSVYFSTLILKHWQFCLAAVKWACGANVLRYSVILTGVFLKKTAVLF